MLKNIDSKIRRENKQGGRFGPHIVTESSRERSLYDSLCVTTDHTLTCFRYMFKCADVQSIL